MLMFHHSERDHSISRHQGNHLRSKGNEMRAHGLKIEPISPGHKEKSSLICSLNIWGIIRTLELRLTLHPIILYIIVIL